MNQSGRYKVHLHENRWRSRLSPDVRVTRKQLMIALQNVQGIYIRATYNYPSTLIFLTFSISHIFLIKSETVNFDNSGISINVNI